MTMLDAGSLEHAVAVAAALMLVISFAMLAQRRLLALVKWFAAQGVVLALTTALVGAASGHGELYVSALLTLVLKGALLPWLVWWIILRLKVYWEVEHLVKVPVTLFFGVFLTLFSFHLVKPLTRDVSFVTEKTLAIALACVLIGLLMMITRRKAVTQVVAFLAIENAIFFTAIGSTWGMPMVVELGIAFDVLMASLLFGLFFHHIHATFDSLDLTRMESEGE
ncbi:MAG: hypothetical protein H7831_04850 [Magnetococcus sp. WYHC-3]